MSAADSLMSVSKNCVIDSVLGIKSGSKDGSLGATITYSPHDDILKNSGFIFKDGKYTIENGVKRLPFDSVNLAKVCLPPSHGHS